MDTSPEVAKLAVDLAESLARNTAASINARIRAAREGKRSDEAIAELESIITELLDDRAQIGRVAQAYQQELVAQRLAPGDIQYISSTVVPLLEKLLAAQVPDGQGDEGSAEGFGPAATLEAVKPMLSVEMVNVLQLLGYDFRAGIGRPLTELTASLIASARKPSDELELARLRREELYLRVAIDPDATERLQRLVGQ